MPGIQSLTAGSGTYLTVVEHGATAGTARPVGAALVMWVGTVDPTNATTDDLLQRTDTSALFRYDGAAWDALGGGGGGDYTLIGETVLTTTATSVVFSSIPSTYRHLRLVMFGRTNQAATESVISVRMNGDTAANYSWQRLYAFSGTAGGATSLAATSIYAGLFPAASATAGLSGSIDSIIPAYAATTLMKTTVSTALVALGGSAGDLLSETNGGVWRNAAAVTQVEVLPSGGSFVAGTVMSLYGISGA